VLIFYTGVSCSGIYWWTAGQRIDPNTESAFVWKVSSADANGTLIQLPMVYTYWGSTEPNYATTGESCVYVDPTDGNSWYDSVCFRYLCAVCEIAQYWENFKGVVWPKFYPNSLWCEAHSPRTQNDVLGCGWGKSHPFRQGSFGVRAQEKI